jgi:hypothetical protein
LAPVARDPRAAIVAVRRCLVLLAGCSLYFASDDDTQPSPVCTGTTQQVRDVLTGHCTEPGVCHARDNAPTCGGLCESFDELQCFGAPTCHGSYVRTGGINRWGGCWDIAPLPVLSGSDCLSLSGYACAQHIECVSVFASPQGDPDNTSFAECLPFDTPGLCTGLQCIPGEQCQLQCGSDCIETCVSGCGSGDCGPGACSGATCTSPPPACPSNTVPGVIGGCWSGYCIPTTACPPSYCTDITDEQTCIDDGCFPVYDGGAFVSCQGGLF